MTFVSPAQGRVTSHWGWRERHPVTGVRGFHRGIDIAPPVPGQTGQPVYAAYGGTVRGVVTGRPRGDRRPNPWTGTWNTGNGVLIDGPGGGSEWYGHLATVDVAAGDRVQPGDRLGTMGASGNVTGVHLHLEMWDSRSSGGGNGPGNTRDPRGDFAKHGITPGSAPDLTKTPTSAFEEGPMFSLDTFNREASRHAENTVKQTTKNVAELIRQDTARQSEALHLAFRGEVHDGIELMLQQIAALPTVTKADVERIRVAILGDVHPKTPGTDLRGAVVTTMQDVKALLSLAQAEAGALAATHNGESFDTDKFLSTVIPLEGDDTTEED